MISNTHVTFTDIQNEFPGEDGTVGQSITDYYAGGKNVPANTTNYLGEAIPSSGQISFTNFLGAEKVIRIRPIVTLAASLATPADINENTQITLTPSVHGRWDSISYNWMGPNLTNTNQATVTYDAPAVDADTSVTLTCIVTAVGGTSYQGVVVKTLTVTFNVLDIPKTRVATPTVTLTATTTEPPSVTVSWSAVPNADSYSVWYEYGSLVLLTTVTNTSLGLSVEPGTTVYARVRANVDDSDPTYKSSEWSATQLATPTTPAVFNQPTAPTSTSTATSATVGWSAPVTGSIGVDRAPVTFDHYLVAATVTNAEPASSAFTSTTSTSHTFNNLLPNTTYYIWIKAAYQYADGKSDLSTSTSISTTTQQLPQLGDPASFNATAGNQSVTLNWSSVANATSYDVRYSLSSTTAWNEQSFSGTSGVVTSLLADTEYKFQIRARGNPLTHRPGTFGSEISVTTLSSGVLPVHDHPSGFTVTQSGLNSAYTVWNTVDNAISYTLSYRKTGGSWTDVVVLDDGNNVQFATVSSLDAEATYEFRLKTNADDSHQESDYTTSSLTLLPVTTLSATLANPGDVEEATEITLEPVVVADAHSIDYQWSGHSGLVNADEKRVTFDAPHVDADTEVTLTCTITARGGTTHFGTITRTVSVTFNITNVPVAPTTVSVTMTSPTNIFVSGDEVTLLAIVTTNGTSLSYDWSSSPQGTIDPGIRDDGTPGSQASFIVPFFVGGGTRVENVTCIVTATGPGGTAQDTATATIRYRGSGGFPP